MNFEQVISLAKYFSDSRMKEANDEEKYGTAEARCGDCAGEDRKLRPLICVIVWELEVRPAAYALPSSGRRRGQPLVWPDS